MTAYRKTPYNDQRDFVRVRDLLIRTYQRTGEARNWMIDRWEFCRAFAHTMMGTTEVWPATGLWTDEAGNLVAVATSEGEGRGEAHFLVDLPNGPLPSSLIHELFDHAERHLAVSSTSGPSLALRLWEGAPELEAEALRRGLKRTWTEVISHRPIDPTETAPLPEGYYLAWGTQVADTAKGRAHVRAFGYATDPRSALTPACWAALRSMPDWRHELELFAVASDGTVAAFVNLWLDTANRLAVCEPVGTDPDHRRLGLARALIVEGGRRAGVLGARELLVGSDQPFYLACGFLPRERHGVWS